jgi:hypothetical protein
MAMASASLGSGDVGLAKAAPARGAARAALAARAAESGGTSQQVPG